jgi:hypothetical protein
MPVEAEYLKDEPVPLATCPRCDVKPLEPFLRGMVQRQARWLGSLLGPPRPYCAVICGACKEIVGWESPLMDDDQTAGACAAWLDVGPGDTGRTAEFQRILSAALELPHIAGDLALAADVPLTETIHQWADGSVQCTPAAQLDIMHGVWRALLAHRRRRRRYRLAAICRDRRVLAGLVAVLALVAAGAIAAESMALIVVAVVIATIAGALAAS